ncbi:MAG TPA: glycosyltransferase family 9 protein [Pirellulales bacterium]
MRINVSLENYYGIGDLVCLSWIAEATRGTPDPISFYAPRGVRYTVLELFGQPVSDDATKAGTCIYQAYQNELQDGGRRRRLDYFCDRLGIQTAFRRPKLVASADDMQWAKQIRQEIGGQHLVLLFPQTHWIPRDWPACYWVDLAWMLHERQIQTVMFLAHEDAQFTNTPRFYWGFPLPKIAALMSFSDLAIGVDSGPVHLSATIGTPTIVLTGPTRPECVFGHMPEVVALTSRDAPGCAGCHFRAPFRPACDQGCQSLYSLTPSTVTARIVAELARPGRPTPVAH